ncbi:MAG: hypothetical protein IJM74_08615 [Bacteroidales bacterium]|nr:hypothetical protein [Bacteroidales bacterium]MBQ6684149.1 hypothetical protein [Bacteroidales bacterium]
MYKKYKLNYDPPKVKSVTFRVENGMQQSFTIRSEMLLEPFGSDSWDNPSSASSTSPFGDGDWTGGSSFSNNSFGSGSWDN